MIRKKIRDQKKPKVIFTDFDGCLTDDRVWLNSEGEEFVAANRKDGLAVNRLKHLEIKVVIISTETNKVVSARAKKLEIDALQGLKDKVLAIDEYLKVNNFTWKDSWYIGNDLNDLGAIQKAQLSFCPKDGVKVIRNQADVVLKAKGGYGVLSEIATILERKYT